MLNIGLVFQQLLGFLKLPKFLSWRERSNRDRTSIERL